MLKGGIEMKKLVCLAGIPGSGKSTYAKKFGFRIISSDDVRKDLYGDQECYYNEKIAQFLIIKNNISTASLSKDAIIHLKEKLCLDYVFDIARKRVCELLQKGESVVYDSTNLMIQFRRDLLIATQNLYDLCELYYLNPPLEIALNRNQNRKYIIDSQIIRDMYYKQQLPTYEEGFDRIYIIKSISDVLLPETMKKSL